MSKNTSTPVRKPATKLQRHHVRHDYHDYSELKNINELEATLAKAGSSGKLDHNRTNAKDIFSDDTENKLSPAVSNIPRGKLVIENKQPNGGAAPFPMKLHLMLSDVEKDGTSHIISWQPHGRCFVVHMPKDFVSRIMPKYFKQSKLTSFQRQLNLYGFSRLTHGKDAGGYYHARFLKGKEFLCEHLIRVKVNGRGVKGLSSPKLEPDFYSMLTCGEKEVIHEKVSNLEDPAHIQPQEVQSVDVYDHQNDNESIIDNDATPLEADKNKMPEQIQSSCINEVSKTSEVQNFQKLDAREKRRMEDIIDAHARLFPPAKRQATPCSKTEKSRGVIPNIETLNIAQSYYQHLVGLKKRTEQMMSNRAEISQEEVPNNQSHSCPNIENSLLSQLNHWNQRLELSKLALPSTKSLPPNMHSVSGGCSEPSSSISRLTDHSTDTIPPFSQNCNNFPQFSSFYELLAKNKSTAQNKSELASSLANSYRLPTGDEHGRNLTTGQPVSLDYNTMRNFLESEHRMSFKTNDEQIVSKAFYALKAGRAVMDSIDSFKGQLSQSLWKLTLLNGPQLEQSIKDHLLTAWIDELLKFLALKVSIDDINIPSKLAPGKPVGIAWKKLMLNPKIYSNLCKAMLMENSIIDYHPIAESVFDTQGRELYSTTWKMYKLCFEEKQPPKLFWPDPRDDKGGYCPSKPNVSEKLDMHSHSKIPPGLSNSFDASRRHDFSLFASQAEKAR